MTDSDVDERRRAIVRPRRIQLLGILRFAREAAGVKADQPTIEQAMPRMPRATAKIVILETAVWFWREGENRAFSRA